MKVYIESMEHDFSFIENNFKVEEKRDKEKSEWKL